MVYLLQLHINPFSEWHLAGDPCPMDTFSSSNKKYWRISNIYGQNVNVTLTNDVVSFEQPGPDFRRNICELTVYRNFHRLWKVDCCIS